MQKDGEHLKRSTQQYLEENLARGEDLSMHKDKEEEPRIIFAGSLPVPYSTIKSAFSDGEEQIRKKATVVFKVNGDTTKEALYKEPEYLTLRSKNMSSEFELWPEKKRTFNKNIETLRTRYTTTSKFIERLQKLFKIQNEKIEADPKLKAEKQTLQIIELFKQGGLSYKEIAEDVGVSEEIVKNRIEAYLSEGKTSPPEMGGSKKFTPEHKSFVIEHLKSTEGKVTAQDIQLEFEKVYEKEGIRISTTTIQGWIKEAGISYSLLKSGKETMTEEQKNLIAEDRKTAARTIVQLLRDPGILTIIYDEVTFQQFDHQKYVYTYKGQDLSKDYEGAKNDKQTVITALVETGEVFYMMHDGATDTNMVLAFVTQVTRLVGSRGYPTIAWFGDNASWHGDMVKVHLPPGVLWVKNAKASPQLSPVENLFAHVKRSFKVHNRIARFQRIGDSIIKSFELLTLDQITGCFRLSLTFMKRAFNKKTIFVSGRVAKIEEEEELVSE